MGLQKFKMSIANTIISQDNASLQSMGTDQLLNLFTLDKVRPPNPELLFSQAFTFRPTEQAKHGNAFPSCVNVCFRVRGVSGVSSRHPPQEKPP